MSACALASQLQLITAESGERRAARYAQQWRTRATDARAEAEQAARAQQLARERAEQLRQHDPYRPQHHHQPGPHRGPSLGL